MHTHSSYDHRAIADEDAMWAKTRHIGAPATQVMGDEESYLATTNRAIGRRIDAERHELFVVCAPAEALEQQFAHHAPDYIALHDLGLDASLRLLQGVAAATGRPVQQLLLRRQGFGVPLAGLRFVELPGPANAPVVRIYSTCVETAQGEQADELVRTVLGYSRLGVFLVGAQAAEQVGQRLRPLRDAMAGAGWRNRQLLWLPIGADAPAVAPASLVARAGGVQLHTAAEQPDLGHAWPVISGLWDGVRNGSVAQPMLASPPPRAPAPVAPLVAPPVVPPVAPAVAPPAQPDAAQWQSHVQACAALPGVLSCCIFNLATERPLAHAGSRPGPATLAAQGAALHEALLHGAKSLGLPAGEPDMALTLADHHLILQALPRHPGLALHAVLDARVANLTLVRMKLQRLAASES